MKVKDTIWSISRTESQFYNETNKEQISHKNNQGKKREEFKIYNMRNERGT